MPAAGDKHLALTPRQREVLERLAAGRTHRQIAREFGMSERTIQDYVGDLKRALGATTAAHAVDIAHRCGLFDPPEAKATPSPHRRWDNPDVIRRRRKELDEDLRGYQKPRKAVSHG